MRPFLPTERRFTYSDEQLEFRSSIIRSVIAASKGVVGKAASTITSTSTANIGKSTTLELLLPILGPASAFGRLIKLSPQADFGSSAALSIPDVVASGTGVGFIAQGGAFPFQRLSLYASPMSPKKLAAGVAITRELIVHSSAEFFLQAAIAANLSLGLETILFDENAGSETRPAGLKNGISALTPDAGTDADAMINDLATLGAAVSAVGGTNIAFIAGPEEFIKIMLRKPSDFSFPVLCSGALAGQVAALAYNALAFAGQGIPHFESAKNGAAVMAEVPVAFSTVGTPNTVAAPIFNPFQQDGVLLRITTDIDWALRSASGFAWMNSVNW